MRGARSVEIGVVLKCCKRPLRSLHHVCAGQHRRCAAMPQSACADVQQPAVTACPSSDPLHAVHDATFRMPSSSMGHAAPQCIRTKRDAVDSPGLAWLTPVLSRSAAASDEVVV